MFHKLSFCSPWSPYGILLKFWRCFGCWVREKKYSGIYLSGEWLIGKAGSTLPVMRTTIREICTSDSPVGQQTVPWNTEGAVLLWSSILPLYCTALPYLSGFLSCLRNSSLCLGDWSYSKRNTIAAKWQAWVCYSGATHHLDFIYSNNNKYVKLSECILA